SSTPPADEIVTAYKGFNQALQCRGFQFDVGKTFKHEGQVEACNSGFHSCEFPLDVFEYYPPADSRFAVVKASGQISRDEGDSKIASASLTVDAEIALPVLAARAVDWVLGQLDKSIEQTLVTGNRSAVTNTGDRSAATNTGDRSAVTNTGDRSAATNTGDWSVAANTGGRSAATNTGDYSAATNTGYRSAATNTGDWSVAANTGDRSATEVKGTESVAASLGIRGRARATAGNAIVLCYRDEDDGHLIHIRASKVGENGIKPDVWYTLNASGEFVEV
ncbi:MAG TPA: DUF7666 domain-containing protein, partial [Xylella sp.]